MRKLFLTFFSIGLFLNFTAAQIQMVSKMSFEDAEMSAYQIDINIAPDQVIDLWDEFWDDHYNIDVDREDRNREREIYLAKEVSAEAISNKPFDIYSLLTTTAEDKTTVSLGFGLGYDIYAGKDQFQEVFQSAERILNEFEAFSYQKFYRQRVADWQKQLEDAREEKADLEEDIAKRESKIEDLVKDINDLRNDLEKARKKNEEARADLPQKTQRVYELERELRAAEQLLTKWQ